MKGDSNIGMMLWLEIEMGQKQGHPVWVSISKFIIKWVKRSVSRWLCDHAICVYRWGKNGALGDKTKNVIMYHYAWWLYTLGIKLRGR